jgi:hypothetical protein
MSNLHDSYTKILSLLHEIEENDCYLNQVRTPVLSDKELIALCLASESLGIDSERYLFKQLPRAVLGKIERSVYNKRRRRLGGKIEWFRQQMVQQLSSSEDLHLIDSMPLEVCKLSRAKRSSICSENIDSSPDYGYCAAQSMHYFGYKIHAVCTEDGVFKTFDISKASIHDIHYLNDVKLHLDNCILIGDKGYLSRQFQDDLFEGSGIELKTPMRNNQINFEPFPKQYRKARKRIETLFSQLCDQFMIRRNYAKSFTGFATRILSKLTALTMIQWINKRSGRNINNLKIVVA